jgi:deazaflavin-dependent oxidoreductase (nitroreductase family)
MPINVKLTTTGRKSGEPRRVTLYAFEDGDRLVVVGSLGGAPKDPQWAGNLRVNPEATVRVDGEPRTVRAREVDGEERDRLWQLVVKGFPLYATYQRNTTRQIPLFVLEPSQGSGSGS